MTYPLRVAAIAVLVTLALGSAHLVAQSPDTTRTHLLTAAREVITIAHFCDLITLDETGAPRSRVMDPFAPDSNLTIWLGTNRISRKVTQIENDPRVTLQYFSAPDGAYVTIAGTAELVDDPAEKETHWKDAWNAFYPDRSAYLLIKVKPQWLELVSARHGIRSDKVTWTPPRVTFDQ